MIEMIGRVRRAMPRNQDVMDICDALEKALVVGETISTAVATTERMLKKSRAEIQRNYRKRKKGNV